jgi:DNA-binding Xre family transcriptional regulator
MISYEPLRILLMRRKLKISNVCKACGLSTNISTRINNDISVTVESLDKICCYLGVRIEEVLEIKFE